MKGRVWPIKNEAVWNKEKKGYQALTPLQIACAALWKARDRGIDVIRVKTPVDPDQLGSKVASEMDFSVQWLAKTMQEDPAFFPDVVNGKITMEDEAVNTMPKTWQFTPDGSIFAPTT